MKILGIDPGYGRLGWSVIDSNLKILDYGLIETKTNQEIGIRLHDIHNEILSIIDSYKPDFVAIEKLFFSKNTKTALNVAKAIGAIILTIKISNLDYCEYSPQQIKMAITGYGRSSKEQMQYMIKKIFNLNEIPKPDDVADAIAIAACHSFSLQLVV